MHGTYLTDRPNDSQGGFRIKPCLNRNIPGVRTTHARTFYGIFLRHDDRQGVLEYKIVWGERVMVGKCMLNGRQTGTTQMRKESSRIADAGNSMHPSTPPEPAQWPDAKRVDNGYRTVSMQGHARFPWTRICSVANKKIEAIQPADGLPQRTGRQQAAVTVPSLPVHHSDFQIPCQAIVL